MLITASVIVHRGTAYVPTTVQLGKGGPYFTIEPVYVAELTTEELADRLEQVISVGNPIIPEPTPEEFKQWRDAILTASGARSWNALARRGAAYGIEWRDNEIIVYLSDKDQKGRFAAGIDHNIRFPKDTTMQSVAAAILEDLRLHPEAL